MSQAADPIACLERGRWHPASHVRSLRALASGRGRYACPERRHHLVQRQVWRADACDIHDPLAGDFGGAFSDRARPVHLALLGDSLGAQVKTAIEGAKSANPRLAHLHFVHGESHAEATLHPLNLATIPRAARGCESLFESIRWPNRGNSSSNESSVGKRGDTPGAAAIVPIRLVLASSGLWYNLKPWCNATERSLFGQFPRCTPAARNLLGHTIRPADLSLDHERPMEAQPRQFAGIKPLPRAGVPQWGWYSWGRRLQGSASLHEYAEDVATFLDVGVAWAANHSATLLWMETTPQHFRNDFAPSELAPPAGTPPPAQHANGSWGCQASANTWRTLVLGEAPPPELDAHCSRRAAPALLTECRGDWRNHVARRLAAQRGVQVVPTAAALSSRAELHSGVGDCTHWCEPSEATLFLATTALNVMARAVLASRSRT
jgi:hypothetical protein